jgi:flagellar export protein FliJ
MSAFETLARVARREAEGIERALAIVEQRRRNVADRIAAHDRNVLEEQKRGAQSPDAALAYGAFAQAALMQRRVMVNEETILAAEAGALRDALRDAFIELKKIETLIEAQAKRAAQEAERLEQAQMDDVAANMMRREG